MRSLLLSRPKSVEKYYNEAKIKVYINDQPVVVLKQGETKEVFIEDKDAIKIQAKSRIWYRSEIKFLQLYKTSRIEIFFNTSTNMKLLIAISLIPIFVILSFNLGLSNTLGIISMFALLVLTVFIIIFFLKNTKNGITIREILS